MLGPSLRYFKTIGVILRANDNLDVIFSERTLPSGRLDVLLCPPVVSAQVSRDRHLSRAVNCPGFGLTWRPGGKSFASAICASDNDSDSIANVVRAGCLTVALDLKCVHTEQSDSSSFGVSGVVSSRSRSWAALRFNRKLSSFRVSTVLGPEVCV
jgi:hypothetical protein